MGRLIYRMCLIVVLVVAVAGWIYYYSTFCQKAEGSRKGTFVNNIGCEEPKAGQVVQAGKQLYETAEGISRQAKDADRVAREAFVYVGDTVKE